MNYVTGRIKYIKKAKKKSNTLVMYIEVKAEYNKGKILEDWQVVAPVNMKADGDKMQAHIETAFEDDVSTVTIENIRFCKNYEEQP